MLLLVVAENFCADMFPPALVERIEKLFFWAVFGTWGVAHLVILYGYQTNAFYVSWESVEESQDLAYLQMS